jgi:hypothetical protein
MAPSRATWVPAVTCSQTRQAHKALELPDQFEQQSTARNRPVFAGSVARDGSLSSTPAARWHRYASPARIATADRCPGSLSL